MLLIKKRGGLGEGFAWGEWQYAAALHGVGGLQGGYEKTAVLLDTTS
jgi:hypothetical protein